MRLISKKQLSLRPALACLFLLLIFACVQEDIYEGVYKAKGGKTEKYCNSQIELMEKGQAVWRVPDDEVTFRWDIKDNEIWLSTKSGGIIIGTIQDHTIRVKLPGAKTVCNFEKIPIE
jgi:hypothetical protein